MTLITHTAADTQLLLAWFYWQMAGGLSMADTYIGLYQSTDI